MTAQPFQTEAIFRGVGDVFLSILLVMLMIAPYLISIVANIGRRAWPASRRQRGEVRARAMLAPPR
jgi:hypothetical protein